MVQKISLQEKLKKILDEYLRENSWDTGSITFDCINGKAKKITTKFSYKI